MKTPKVGLLPLYLKLYDDISTERRDRIDNFYKTIGDELESHGLEVLRTGICRIKEEFERAVSSFETAEIDALITLHLAYSPSLESAKVLSGTDLPIIVCDTTPTYSYGPDQDPGELMFNHGIHGVQDMANLLIRNEKDFVIEAGHWKESDVLDRVSRHAMAAAMAHHLRRAKVGLIGEPFKGMGDFYLTPEQLKSSIGAEVLRLDSEKFKKHMNSVSDKDIDEELAENEKLFEIRNVDDMVHRRTAKVSCAVRKWIEGEGLSAFTFNFLNITKDAGFDTVPFLIASKLMAEGIGYAGEGDVLTASVVAALSQADGATSFSEMFCPDWQNDSIFLSHMGEMNHRLVAGKPILSEKEYPYSDAENPAAVSGRFKEGDFHIVNPAPLPGGRYRLIIAPCRMLHVTGKDNMEGTVRGWFKPPLPVPRFLEAYSRLGGTHHLAVVYETDLETLRSFGRMMGWEVAVIC